MEERGFGGDVMRDVEGIAVAFMRTFEGAAEEEEPAGPIGAARGSGFSGGPRAVLRYTAIRC